MKKLTGVLIGESRIPIENPELVNRTQIFVNDVLLIMKELYNIYRGSQGNRQTVKLRDLKVNGDQMRWVDLLGEYFNQADNHIDDEVKVDTKYLKYLQKLGPMIDALKRNYSEPVFNRIMNNYFAWSLIEAYAWHLSYDFSSIHRQHHGIADSDLEMDCFVFTHEIFNTILGAIYVENHVNEVVWNHTTRLVSYVKPSALKQLETVKWLDTETKDKIRERIEGLKLVTDLPLIMQNDVKLDYAYREIKISFVYLNNLLNMIQYMRAVYNRILAGIAEPHENSWLHDTVNVYDTKIGINLVRDELYIPPGIVQPPFFHQKLPAVINFAGIGSMLATAVARLIGESGSFILDDQVTLLWSEQSWSKFVQHWDCIDKRVRDKIKVHYNISDNLMELVGESLRSGVDEIVDEATGLNIAKIGFDSWFAVEESSKENTLLPGPHIPRDKLFYTSYAQTFCETNMKSRNWWQMILMEESVPPEILVNQVLSEEPDFGATFQCQIGSPMRPEKICSAIF